jgi:hypothetical protein
MAGMSLSKCSGPSLVRAPNGPTKIEPGFGALNISTGR